MELNIDCPNCGEKSAFEFQEAYYQETGKGTPTIGSAPPPIEPERAPDGDWNDDQFERVSVYLCAECSCLAKFFGL